jgi:hypothetical protein
MIDPSPIVATLIIVALVFCIMEVMLLGLLARILEQFKIRNDLSRRQLEAYREKEDKTQLVILGDKYK